MIVSLRAEKFFIGSRKVLLIRFARSSGDRSRWSVFSNWSWEIYPISQSNTLFIMVIELSGVQFGLKSNA